jgi:hypothetical protein
VEDSGEAIHSSGELAQLLFLLLHRAFLRFINYQKPTNARYAATPL